MITIPIIYASTSGNVEVVCQSVAEKLNLAGIPNSLHRAEQTELDLVISNDIIIYATSTWEHGEINPYFHSIMNGMKNLDLSGKKAAFIGLGDLRYEPVLFCGGMEQLRDTYLHQGGAELIRSIKINGEPYRQLDKALANWTNVLISALQNEIK